LSLSSYSPLPPLALHSFPTRRSSDLPRPLPLSIRAPLRTHLAHHETSRRHLDHRASRSCHVSTKAPASSVRPTARGEAPMAAVRSEEHTSELQSRENLVCRLLLEKKK